MHMSQHTFLAAALLGGLLAVGALPAWAADAEVMIDNFIFSPTEITVTTGTRVTWTNRDDVPHTVTDSGNPSALKSPLLDTGESFASTFDRPGDYTSSCSLHPHMQGAVVVEAAYG
jgi:plastocyanin